MAEEGREGAAAEGAAAGGAAQEAGRAENEGRETTSCPGGEAETETREEQSMSEREESFTI